MKRYVFLFVLLSVGCKKEAIPDPNPAMLIGPVNNDKCNTATVLSNQKSQVNFSWQEADHTDEYELVVRDILTNVDQKKRTIRFSSTCCFGQGKQYSWWVNSQSEQTENITKSEVWTFYLEEALNQQLFPFSSKTFESRK